MSLSFPYQLDFEREYIKILFVYNQTHTLDVFHL